MPFLSHSSIGDPVTESHDALVVAGVDAKVHAECSLMRFSAAVLSGLQKGFGTEISLFLGLFRTPEIVVLQFNADDPLPPGGSQ